MHDRAGEGEARPDTAERVGFVETLNFACDAAQNDPQIAARLMAMTWKAREDIKAAAGIKPGGSKAEAPPVWHSSLSWVKSEQPGQVEMMHAVRSYLEYQGLGIEKGYQTYIVQHTDTAHPHVHIVVNLVHPDTGKQISPSRDQQRGQAWARAYDKQRGQVHCHKREAKYAAIDQARNSHATPGRASFNEAAKGGSAKPDAYGRSRDREHRPGNSRQAWTAQQAKSVMAREAGSRIRAELDAKYHGLRSRHDAAYQKRQQDIKTHRADSQAERGAIYDKYKTALDAIWKPTAQQDSGMDRTAWAKLAQHLADRQTTFNRQEETFGGRLQNAAALSAGKSTFAIIRLAMNGTERRRLFEREQRQTRADFMPRGPERPKSHPRPNTPEPRKVQAERLKMMRSRELAQHSRKTEAAAAALKARHQFQQTAEQGQRAIFAKEAKAAWAQHKADFAQERANAGAIRQPAAAPAEQARSKGAAPRTEKGATADRYGRSRDRKPRAPRPGRDDKSDNRAANMNAKAENLPAEGAVRSESYQTTPEPSEAIHAQDLGQGEPVSEQAPKMWTAEERAAMIAAEDARQAALRAERGQERGTGREISR